jgi:peptide/nickel transport system permease protein
VWRPGLVVGSTALLGLVVVLLLYEFAARWYAPGQASFGAAGGTLNLWVVRGEPTPLELARGGLDLSARAGVPGAILVLAAAWNSMFLVLLAITLACVLGIPAGFWLAVHAPRSLVSVLRSLTNLGIALPAFFVAFLLQVVAVEITGRLGHTFVPVYGFGVDGHLVIPVISLTAGAFAYITRFVLVAATDLNTQDFVRTARGKGLSERSVVYRHIAPNMIGTLGEAVLGGVRFVLGALVIVEYLVVWPGLGVLALRAVNVQDLPVLLGSVAVLGVLFFATEMGLDVLTRRTGVVTG